MTTRKFAQFSVWGAVRGRGLFEFFCRQFALKPDQGINEIRESIENSLRSNHFRAVAEQRTRNESQRPRQKMARSISRMAKTENHVPRSFFAPKPCGNACYAG